jgi:hypothetical protein
MGIARRTTTDEKQLRRADWRAVNAENENLQTKRQASNIKNARKQRHVAQLAGKFALFQFPLRRSQSRLNASCSLPWATKIRTSGKDDEKKKHKQIMHKDYLALLSNIGVQNLRFDTKEFHDDTFTRQPIKIVYRC